MKTLETADKLMLADNKIALNAGWDLEMLAVELNHAHGACPDDVRNSRRPQDYTF